MMIKKRDISPYEQKSKKFLYPISSVTFSHSTLKELNKMTRP